MRILLVTFGPIARPTGGLTVRARQAAESLTRLGHAVTVLSTEEPEEPEEPDEPEAPDEPRPRPWPCVVLTEPSAPWGSAEFSRLFPRLRADADAVVIESALFVPALVRAGGFSGTRHVPVIWDTNECETLHYSRLPPTRRNLGRRIFWRALEECAARLTDVTVAISEEEAAQWARLVPSTAGKLAVVSHAVPIPASLPVRHAAEGHAAEGHAAVRPAVEGHAAEGLAAEGRPVVGFVGNAGSKQNATAVAWIVTELAPALVDRADVVLVGPHTDEIAARLGAGPNVRALGQVPDADAALAGVTLAVAPSEAAAGVKTKLLHYVALGLPVVATENATEGLTGAPGVTVASLAEMPAVVRRLLEEPEEAAAAEQRRASQRSWLEEHHGPAVVDAAWDELLTRARSGPRAVMSVDLAGVAPVVSAGSLDPAALIAASEQPPVFIVGCPRSGTTLVQLIVDAHPAFAVPPELELVAYVGLHPRSASWTATEALDRIVAYPSFALLGIEAGTARAIVAAVRPDGVAGVIRALLGAYALGKGAERWAEKTPIQAFYLDGLARLFPDACFVHVIRDGRDTAASLAEMVWGPGDIAGAAFTWRHAVRSARRAGRRLGPGRYLEVRLEDLVDDPEATARALCDFLGVAYDPAVLEYWERSESPVMASHRGYHPNLRKPPSPNLRDWREGVAPSMADAMEAYLGPTLREFGYAAPEGRSLAARVRGRVVAEVAIARRLPRLAGVLHAMTGRRIPAISRAEVAWSAVARLVRRG